MSGLPSSVRPGRAAFVGVWLASLCVLAAAPARALSIDDTNPIFFDGPGGLGFTTVTVEAAGLAPAFSADPDDGWLTAGGGKKNRALDIGIAVDLQRVHKNPQAGNRKPTPANPLIADSAWTITNRTGEPLGDVLLVFTLGDARAGKKRPKPVGLDGNWLEILEYSNDGVDYLFGAVRLGDLAAGGPGSSTEIDVRYIVGGRLPRRSGRIFLPPLGVSAVTGWSAVPEPSTGACVALGMLVLGTARRRRSHRRPA